MSIKGIESRYENHETDFVYLNWKKNKVMQKEDQLEDVEKSETLK